MFFNANRKRLSIIQNWLRKFYKLIVYFLFYFQLSTSITNRHVVALIFESVSI